MYRNSCRHAVKRSCDCTPSINISSAKDVPLGRSDRLAASQSKALHILTDEFADAVVSQDTRGCRSKFRNVKAMQVKGNARYLVILFANCLNHPTTCHATRCTLGRGVNDLAMHQHLGRATGVHIHHFTDVGTHLTQNLACLGSRTAT